jgi:hypothetical protein
MRVDIRGAQLPFRASASATPAANMEHGHHGPKTRRRPVCHAERAQRLAGGEDRPATCELNAITGRLPAASPRGRFRDGRPDCSTVPITPLPARSACSTSTSDSRTSRRWTPGPGGRGDGHRPDLAPTAAPYRRVSPIRAAPSTRASCRIIRCSSRVNPTVNRPPIELGLDEARDPAADSAKAQSPRIASASRGSASRRGDVTLLCRSAGRGEWKRVWANDWATGGRGEGLPADVTRRRGGETQHARRSPPTRQRRVDQSRASGLACTGNRLGERVRLSSEEPIFESFRGGIHRFGNSAAS